MLSLRVSPFFSFENLMSTATKLDPEKWARAKARARARMGGKHSARAMQAVKYYRMQTYGPKILTNYGDGRNKGGRMQESAVRPDLPKAIQVFHHPKGQQRIERSEKTLPLENNTQANWACTKNKKYRQHDANQTEKIRIQQRYAEISKTRRKWRVASKKE